MKILLTGGSGFIARHLYQQFTETSSRLFDSNLEIIPRNSKELNLLDTDKVFSYIKENKFDIVVHTATWDVPSHSSKDPTKVLEYNLKMFFNLARCEDYFGKMIYFGSGAEFTREQWIPKMKESYFDQHLPSDQYGLSKYIMAKYTYSKWSAENPKIYNLRLFGVFGEYDDWRIRFTAHACYCALSDRPITIRQNVFFDYLYIDDLIKIVKWFFYNQPQQPVYNVCTGQVIDLKTIAEKILAISSKISSTISKKDLPIIIDKPGLGREYSGDNSLLMGELKKKNFSTFYNFSNFQFSAIEDSLAHLYRWFYKNSTNLL